MRPAFSNDRGTTSLGPSVMAVRHGLGTKAVVAERRCHFCTKPLTNAAGTVVVADGGRRYHVHCCLKRMDTAIREH